MDSLKLKSGQDRRIKRGHPWVYSNEIDVAATPLKGVDARRDGARLDSAGDLIGYGHASPASLIAVRLLSRAIRGEPSTTTLIARRLARALRWRERLYAQPYYRWVFGEGDELPGLVVDRYGDACVVQTSTWGMEAALDRDRRCDRRTGCADDARREEHATARARRKGCRRTSTCAAAIRRRS